MGAEQSLETQTSRRGHFECRVLGRIHRVLRELFQCAVTEIGDSNLWPSSRAIYGVDVLLKSVAVINQAVFVASRTMIPAYSFGSELLPRCKHNP